MFLAVKAGARDAEAAPKPPEPLRRWGLFSVPSMGPDWDWDNEGAWGTVIAFLELFKEGTVLDIIALDGMRMLLMHKWKFLTWADQPFSKPAWVHTHTYLT